MKIEFENGSTIEALESFQVVRAERSKDIKTIVPIEVGLKVNIRDFVLENLKNEPYITENFKLNIKRLNRWWYSVYFDKK